MGPLNPGVCLQVSVVGPCAVSPVPATVFVFALKGFAAHYLLAVSARQCVMHTPHHTTPALFFPFQWLPHIFLTFYLPLFFWLFLYFFLAQRRMPCISSQ